MDKSFDIEEEINSNLDTNAKNRIHTTSEHLLEQEKKNFKLSESSKIRYFLPTLDFAKITKTEFDKLDLLEKDEKKYIELAKILIKHGKTLNEDLSKSINWNGLIKCNLFKDSIDDLTSSQDELFNDIRQKLSNMYKSLEDVKSNLLKKSEEVNIKKEQLIDLQKKFEKQNENYMRRMKYFIEKKSEIGKSSESEISLNQENMLHEISVYDAISENIVKKLTERSMEYASSEKNLKSIVDKKLKEKYGLIDENSKIFVKTKSDSMNREVTDLSLKFKVRLKNFLNEEHQIVEKLFQEMNLLKMNELNIHSNIKSVLEEITLLQKKVETLSDIKNKFEKFLNGLNNDNDKFISLGNKNFLTDFSIDMSFSQNTSYSAVYLSMLEESNKFQI